jgi:hypothetical protein
VETSVALELAVSCHPPLSLFVYYSLGFVSSKHLLKMIKKLFMFITLYLIP